MRRRQNIFLLLLLVCFYACSPSVSSTADAEELEDCISEDGYVDGTYCADVEYYNPNTQTVSNYKLNVKIKNGLLTTLFWPNGGWLDEDHFEPDSLEMNGSCSFVSDKGYEYIVEVSGPACDFRSLEGINNRLSGSRLNKDRSSYRARRVKLIHERQSRRRGRSVTPNIGKKM